MPKKVVAYIDGFNLYHGIDDLGDNTLKWLDLRKLVEGLINPSEEEITAVYYFTAYATWKPDAYKRHRDYVRALTAQKVIPVFGKFKENYCNCKNCSSRWKEHVEKETDVNIAVQMIHDAHTKAYDHAILITGDSDQAPTIKKAKSIHAEGYISVWVPPGRNHGCDSLGPRRDIRPARVENCQLPDRVLAADGSLLVERPVKYRNE